MDSSLIYPTSGLTEDVGGCHWPPPSGRTQQSPRSACRSCVAMSCGADDACSLDTLPDTSRSCSVQRRSYRHGSLTGLPGPVHGAGRVRLAVQHQPAGGTGVAAHAETLLDTRPAAATILAGVLRRNRHDLTPGACCLGVQEAAKLCPARVLAGLG